MKPAVIEPSHMPRISRTANRPPKLLQAACAHKATPQMNILILHHSSDISCFIKRTRLTSSTFQLEIVEVQGFEDIQRRDSLDRIWFPANCTYMRPRWDFYGWYDLRIWLTGLHSDGLLSCREHLKCINTLHKFWVKHTLYRVSPHFPESSYPWIVSWFV